MVYSVTERRYARDEEATNSSTSGNGSGGDAYIVGMEDIGREMVSSEDEDDGCCDETK